MFHDLHNVRIAGLRAAVGSREIRIEDEAEFYGGSKKKIARMSAALGMDRRRVCEPDVTSSDICAFAATDLLKAFPGVKDKIDVLLFLSQSPDWHQPPTACELQHRLGLPQGCAAFDANQGCAGYVYALWIAASILASGGGRNALVLVGDVNSQGRDNRNRIMAPVFGDGGSATLLVRDDTAAPMTFSFGTNGAEFETIITPGGAARIPLVREAEENVALEVDNFDPHGNPWQVADTWMDGGAVFNFTMDVVPDHLREVIAHAGKSHRDIDNLILHQANSHIVGEVAAKAGFDRINAPADSFSRYGNLASASIPAALCDAFGSGGAPGTVLMCGFGIGLAWGSCLCHIDSWNCAPVLVFEADPNRPTRAQRIERWQKIMRGEISRHD